MTSATSATSVHTTGPIGRRSVRQRADRVVAPGTGRRRPTATRHDVRRAAVRPSSVSGQGPSTSAAARTDRSDRTDRTDRTDRSKAGVADVALAQSRGLLADARREVQASDRFRLAHLAALRAAAALLSVHDEPSSGRRRPQSAWTLIDRRVPRFRDWAAYFAAGARARAAADAGLRDAVTPARAAELLDATELFLFLVAAEVRAEGPVEQAVIPPPLGAVAAAG